MVGLTTTDSSLQGERTITISLAEAEGGTEILDVHDALPPGPSTVDYDAGWREALRKLAAPFSKGGR